MNDKRRTKLKQAQNTLRLAITQIDMVADEEQDAFDNMPETMQAGDRCQRMEENVDTLRDAIEVVEKAIDMIAEAAS